MAENTQDWLQLNWVKNHTRFYFSASHLGHPDQPGHKKRDSFVMNNKKIKHLIDGYESIRTISKKEKNSLNILCRGAALRYLLTRIYDYLNTPKTALIQIKEPNEYFQKLIIHNNLNNYKDYYK